MREDLTVRKDSKTTKTESRTANRDIGSPHHWDKGVLFIITNAN